MIGKLSTSNEGCYVKITETNESAHTKENQCTKTGFWCIDFGLQKKRDIKTQTDTEKKMDPK